MDEIIKVDVLTPPTFEKSGVTKYVEEARDDGDWIGTFNLWIVQTSPFPAIIYQQRPPDATWAPNCLDVSSAGHYSAGESLWDGLREVKEELGKTYAHEDITYLGRRLNVAKDIQGRLRNTVIEIGIIVDNAPIESFILDPHEIVAICVCPLEDLVKVQTQENYSFEAQAIRNDRTRYTIKVTKDLFPYNWDNYHFKMALIAERFVRGERNLIY
jgi:hypothetical protein